MTIRNLELKDLEQVFNLLNELYEGKIQYDVFNKKYRNNLQDNNFYGILAEENDKITGVLISRLINRLAKSKDILFVDDLIVNKDYRRNGIGKLLLQNATNYAIDKNCETIELVSYITNENSHRFYESNGFKKQYYKFKKSIKGENIL